LPETFFLIEIKQIGPETPANKALAATAA